MTASLSSSFSFSPLRVRVPLLRSALVPPALLLLLLVMLLIVLESGTGVQILAPAAAQGESSVSSPSVSSVSSSVSSSAAAAALAPHSAPNSAMFASDSSSLSSSSSSSSSSVSLSSSASSSDGEQTAATTSASGAVTATATTTDQSGYADLPAWIDPSFLSGNDSNTATNASTSAIDSWSSTGAADAAATVATTTSALNATVPIAPMPRVRRLSPRRSEDRPPVRDVDRFAPPRPTKPAVYVYSFPKCGGPWIEYDLSGFVGATNGDCMGIELPSSSSSSSASSMPLAPLPEIVAALNCTQQAQELSFDLVEYESEECDTHRVKWRITASLSVEQPYAADWACADATRFTGFFDDRSGGDAGGPTGTGTPMSVRVLCPSAASE